MSSSSSSKLPRITSAASLEKYLRLGGQKQEEETAGNQTTKKAVFLFDASWHEGCTSVEAILAALVASSSSSSSLSSSIHAVTIDAEECSELTDRYEVTVVPTVLFVVWNGTTTSSAAVEGTILERLDDQVEPAQLTTAFQRLLLLQSTEVSSSSLSTSTKDPSPSSTLSLTERLDHLIRTDTVMLFMKGTPTTPKCGFSRQVVEILQQHHVPFSSFNILTDEDVRQGLKTHSNWPTYPQVYVNGELQGGLDILKELAEQGSLAEQFDITPVTATTAPTLEDRLRELVSRSDVMLFMKGLPSAPKCGFSRQIVALLDESGVPYDAFDILQDEDVRQGLKTFSNWPTFPQLYVKGELIGGLDICKELEESGEFKSTLLQQ